MVRRGAGAGVEWIGEPRNSWPAGSAASGTAACRCSPSAGADLGRYPCIANVAVRSVRPDLGRRAGAASASAGTGAIVGRAGDFGTARPDVGLARARAFAVSTASASLMGRAQARIAGTTAAGAIVEWGRRTGRTCCRTVLGFGRDRVGRAATRVVGRSGLFGSECRTERRAVVGSACGAVMGGAQIRRARRAAGAVMVSPHVDTRTARSPGSGAPAGRSRLVATRRRSSACGPVVVAAGRVTAAAEVS
jgi:hypothetical protein